MGEAALAGGEMASLDPTGLPFGSPEGENTSLSAALDLGDSLKLPDGGLKVRAFVGWKGTGKTLYLKLHHEAAQARAHRDGIYVEPDYSYRQPSSDAIIEFSARSSQETLVDRWQTAWKRSAILAAASHLAYARELRDHNDIEESSPPHFRRLLRLCGGAIGIYDAFTVLNEHDEVTRGRGPLDSAEWNKSLLNIARVASNSPPISLYADMMDAEYEIAPSYWMKCQLGLLKAIASLLEDPQFGGRVHVTVTLRDHTLALLGASEHQTKMLFQAYLKTLEWDYTKLKALLFTRIGSLSSEYLTYPGLASSDPMRAWLGFDRVENEVRGVSESAVGYIIRHTRLVPRDLVVLGNAISMRVASAGPGEFTALNFKQTISDCARRFGAEQIAVCAQQIAADSLPSEAIDGSLGSTYWGSAGFRQNLASLIERTVAANRVDRFGVEGLERMRSVIRVEHLSADLVFSAMWVNRLLGIVETDPVDGVARCRFFGSSTSTSILLPNTADEYVLHPCLIDTVPSVAGKGSDPVILGRGWDE